MRTQNPQGNPLLGIIKKVGILTVSTTISQALSFLFGMVLVRHISINEFAVYRQGLLIITVAFACILVLNPVSLSYFLAKGIPDQDQRRYISQTVMFSNLLCLIGSGGIFILKGGIVSSFNNPNIGKYLALFAIWGFFENSISFYPYFMIVRSRLMRLTVVTVSFSFLRIVALLISIRLGSSVFNTFILMNIILLFLKYLVSHYDVGRDMLIPLRSFSFSLFRTQMAFAFPIYVSTLIMMLNSNIDKLYVSVSYPDFKYAIYSIGAFEIPFVSAVGGSILAIMIPEIARLYDGKRQDVLDQLIQTYRKILVACFCFSLPLAMVLVLFSSGVIELLFTTKYLDANNLFKIYCCTSILTSINLGALITAAGRQNEIVKSGILMLISNVMVLIAVRHSLGFDWLTLGPLFALIVAYLYNLAVVKSAYLQRSLLSLFPLKALAECIGISFVCSLPFRYLYVAFGNGRKPILVGACFGAFLLGLISCWLIVHRSIAPAEARYV